jgi:hypothetical protein
MAGNVHFCKTLEWWDMFYAGRKINIIPKET